MVTKGANPDAVHPPEPRFGTSRTMVVASTGSTNSDLVARARAGDWSITVLAADFQSSGRGRLDRTWEAEPGEALLVSFLLQVADVHPLVPLAFGLAALDAVRSTGGTTAALKWPNDVLVDDRKLAGMLVETVVVDGEIVGAAAGLGMNLLTAPPGAVSLGELLAEVRPGAPADELKKLASRDQILAAVSARFDAWLTTLRSDSGAAALLDAYRAGCATIGQAVRVDRVDGMSFEGVATGIDGDGRLVVDTAGTTTTVHAGDVHHLRPASP